LFNGKIVDTFFHLFFILIINASTLSNSSGFAIHLSIIKNGEYTTINYKSQVVFLLTCTTSDMVEIETDAIALF